VLIVAEIPTALSESGPYEVREESEVLPRIERSLIFSRSKRIGISET
jgi:hypothetical protein